MASLKLHVIVGSVREGRISRPIADWVMGQLAGNGTFDAELVDLKDWALPPFALPRPPAAGNYTDPLQIRWAEKVAQADAYLLVAPEYNHALSAPMKNALDYVFAEWGRKPVACVAHGTMGGARAVEQMRAVAVALDMAPLNAALHLQGVGKKRDGEAWLGDEADARRLGGVIDDLAWWGKALKAARES